MSKRTLFRLAGVTLIFFLTACGTFMVDVHRLDDGAPTSSLIEDYPGTSVPVSDVVPEMDDEFRSPSLLGGFGLIEIIIILSLFVAASLVVGGYFLIRDRTPASDYPQLHDSGKSRKSIAQLLRFKPDIVSLILALCTWAVLLGMIAIVASGILFLLRDTFTETWEPTLTPPSSMLIGEDSPYVRLPPDQMNCALATQSEDSQQMVCDAQFEGSLLTVEVTLEDGMAWYCSAFYAGEPVPCWASFDMKDYQTYIVFPTNLGLSVERYQELVENYVATGWGEQDWLRLAKAVVIGFSLAALFVLWRYSTRSLAGQTGPNNIFQFIYVFGISLMIFGVANYLSFWLLVVFRLID